MDEREARWNDGDDEGEVTQLGFGCVQNIVLCVWERVYGVSLRKRKGFAIDEVDFIMRYVIWNTNRIFYELSLCY